MELTRSEVSPFAWMTGSLATNVIAPSDPQQLAAILITTGLAFLAALGLRYLNTTLSGMTLSLYGIALCQSLIFATLGGNRKPTLEQAIPTLLGFGCMTVGFTWLLNGFPSNRRPARFLWLSLGLLIPVALNGEIALQPRV